MKALKEIKKAIAKNRETIEANKNKIMALDYTEERREAVKDAGRFNNEAWRELHEKAEANADEIKKLSDDNYILEIEARILKENAKAALFAEAYPVILKAFEKYDGKQYGEKTADKIREEVHAAGFGFYFSGHLHNDTINIYELRDGLKNHVCEECTAHGKYSAETWPEFITNDNKINIKNVDVSPLRYTEKPGQEARKVAKAIKHYTETTRAAEKERAELAQMLPDGIASPEWVKEYYIRF